MTHNKNSTRYYSTKQEHKLAKTLNCKLTSNSGAGLFKKGDLYNTNRMVIRSQNLYERARAIYDKKGVAG